MNVHDDEQTDHNRRGDFELTDTERALLRQVQDPAMSKILEILMKVEKQNVLGVKGYYLAKKHERILSPFVQLGIWTSSAVGFLVLVLEIIRFFTHKP